MSRRIGPQNSYGSEEPVVIERFVAGEAIAVGNVVSLDTTDKTGLQVLQSDANTVGVGIALDAATADGDEIRVQTRGIGLVEITTGGSAAASTALKAGAAGATAEVAAGTACYAPIGYALAADSSTTLAAGNYYLTAGPWID